MATVADEEEEEMEMEKQLLQAAPLTEISVFSNVTESLSKEGRGIAETIKDIRCSKGLCALHHAAAAGKTEICQYLIKELGIPVDFRSSSSPSMPFGVLAGGTSLHNSLHYAARKGQSVTVYYLIEQGADPTATDKESSTPLHHAAIFGHDEVVKFLLSQGIPIDPENYLGTPLHLAASNSRESVVETLLKHGAEVNKLKHGILTPLKCTIIASSLKCTKLLIEAGADLNLRSPLTIAVYQNEMELMKCLLDAGADPNYPSENDGKLAIKVAIMLDRREMAEILFPLTSPIPQIPCWSIEGLYIHVASVIRISMRTEK